MRRLLPLAGFLVLVVGGGLLIGSQTRPDAWFQHLAKPPFQPPNWIFAPVWTVLYVCIAVAGWRTFREAPTSWAMALWWLQLVLNFGWSPLFFGAHLIGLALVVIAALLFAIASFMIAAVERDRIAATLFVPYGAWVGFATVLNAWIYAHN
jgi:benzodiazapine receptor